MVFSTKLFREIDKLEPDLKAVMLEMLSEIERNREESITRKEFLEFARQSEENFQRVWKSIDQLAEAQKRTEQRVDTLAARMEELAEAQKRTEQRVEELAEAQKRTEQRVDTLAARMEELAEAQKRTEQRVEELAEAQKRTEQRVDTLAVRMEELAEAQKRTETSLAALTAEHKKTREQLGGLSATVGYTLENKAFKALPDLLKADYGITLKGKLIRDHIPDNQGDEIEVNILGKGERDGKEVLIVGESKSQLSAKYIDEFIRKKLNRLQGIHPNLFPVLVTHMVSSSAVKRYAKEKGLALYFSYQF